MDTSNLYIEMCDCSKIRKIIWDVIKADHQRKIDTSERDRDTEYCVRIPDIRTPDVVVFDEDGKVTRQINLWYNSLHEREYFTPI